MNRLAWVLAALALAGCTLPGCTRAGASPAGSRASGTARVSSSASSSASRSPSASPTRHHPAVVVGLGDSVTAATGCDCDGFIDGLAAALPSRLGGPATAINLGAAGATTSDLLAALRDDDPTRAAVARADVIVVTIGANDLGGLVDTWEQRGACATSCQRTDIGAMGSGLDRVLAAIDHLRPVGSRVLVTSYWNVYADGDVAENERGTGFLPWSDTVTRSANVAIARSAAAHGDTLVDLYSPFKGEGEKDPTELLADDGDHPNAEGHRVIDAALLAALR